MSDRKPVLSQTNEDRSSLWSALASAFRAKGLEDDNMLPAQVVAYDRTNIIATVKPLIQLVTTADTLISRNPLSKIPVVALGGGGFVVNFPLTVGDLGWILAADRDISLYLQYLRESPPNTGRIHKFEDGLFIPDIFRKYTIAGEDSSAMVIQALDSTTRLAIDNGQIRATIGSTKIVATTSSVTTTTTHIVDNVTDHTINGNLIVNGMTTLNGGISQVGGSAPTSFQSAPTFQTGFASSTDVTINGRSFMGHTHADPQGGNTLGVN